MFCATKPHRRSSIISALLICTILIAIIDRTQAFQPSMIHRCHNGMTSSSSLFPLYHSRDTNAPYQSQPQLKSYTAKVTHQNKTTKFQIYEDETILQALERSKIHDELALPSLPQECRRGNCLTCSGRLMTCASDSNGDSDSNDRKSSNVEIRKDGLSPNISRTIKEKGIVPTCSTFVVGEGVHVELGVCDEVWREIYADDDAEGERLRNDAMAKAMRLSDEKNLHRWALKTTKMLEDGHDGSQDIERDE